MIHTLVRFLDPKRPLGINIKINIIVKSIGEFSENTGISI
jgi:hypothetical protein